MGSSQPDPAAQRQARERTEKEDMDRVLRESLDTVKAKHRDDEMVARRLIQDTEAALKESLAAAKAHEAALKKEQDAQEAATQAERARQLAAQRALTAVAPSASVPFLSNGTNNSFWYRLDDEDRALLQRSQSITHTPLTGTEGDPSAYRALDARLTSLDLLPPIAPANTIMNSRDARSHASSAVPASQSRVHDYNNARVNYEQPGMNIGDGYASLGTPTAQDRYFSAFNLPLEGLQTEARPPVAQREAQRELRVPLMEY